MVAALVIEDHIHVTDSGCHEWTGARRASGYAQVRRQYGHRWAYEQAHGPIPPGMCVCHRCDNKPCINPDHLYLATAATNTKDAGANGLMTGNRSRGGEQGRPQSRLTEADVRAIRSDGRSLSAIARDLGVGISTVHRVRHGLSWTHVTSIGA